ncbi:alpha/beta fold hydrolase [Sandaracinus amylolyticus]|uniref:alpha/beta fold hydrolase n=1 Tax=Sandaracinus amylolyticus TaxID=927083 RepID=UPI001F1CB4C2|nr:alpha/beta hydrolase [Sandaracinus amylolyticus]UJR80201.1 Pimeloyl-ACP methyl ester carboxylesterase [Sandaracinus amylolyticus]
MRRAIVALTVLLASCAGAPSVQPSPRGLDAQLTTFPYPHEVRMHPIVMQGHALEMAYMDVAPSGPARGTVVLLHGKNFSGAYWARTIDALVALGFRVIAPDQIGFGRSSKPIDVQYSLHTMARHTLDLLDARGVQGVAVVGHSMGGMLATRIALVAPDRVERLALVSPIGLEDWQRVAPYATVDALYQQERRRTPDDVRGYMRDAYFAGRWDPSYEALVAIQVGWLEGPDANVIARVSALTSDMIFTQPVVHEFGDLRVPTLLVIGQRDRTALGRDRASAEVAATLGDHPALGRRAAEAIPGARLVELDDVGHVPHFEAFDRFFEPLSSFLTDER